MKYLELYNGYSLPSIGYGTFPQKESLIKNLKKVAQCGYEMIDCSDNYHNEIYVGEGISNVDEEQRPIIITKFSSPNRSTEVYSAFMESRKKLGDCINIYLLHWPYPFLWKRIWSQMEKIYLSGKCDAIGVCNFDVRHLRKIMRCCSIKPMINQIEVHPDFQQKEIVEFCKLNEIQVMSYSPLGRGCEKLSNNKTISKIAQNHKKTVSQIILKWHIYHGLLPIPASTNPEHFEQNINIFDFELTEDEILKIDGEESGNRVRYDPRKRFTLTNKTVFLLKFYLFHKIKAILKGMKSNPDHSIATEP